MNNQELERKIKEIISTENFFDAAELAAEFNKDYKKTSFFKKTRMPLADVIKNAKMWYLLDLGSLFNSIQEKIGELAAIYRTTTDNIVAEIQKNVNLLHSMNQQVVTEKVTKLLIDNAKVTYTK